MTHRAGLHSHFILHSIVAACHPPSPVISHPNHLTPNKHLVPLFLTALYCASLDSLSSVKQPPVLTSCMFLDFLTSPLSSDLAKGSAVLSLECLKVLFLSLFYHCPQELLCLFELFNRWVIQTVKFYTFTYDSFKESANAEILSLDVCEICEVSQINLQGFRTFYDLYYSTATRGQSLFWPHF